MLGTADVVIGTVSHLTSIDKKDDDACAICFQAFGFFDLTYVCSVCTSIICDDCSGHRVQGKRICNNCHKEAPKRKAREAQAVQEAKQKIKEVMGERAAVKACMTCTVEFGFIDLKYTCSTCPTIVCDDCSDHRLNGKRICKFCVHKNENWWIYSKVEGCIDEEFRIWQYLH